MTQHAATRRPFAPPRLSHEASLVAVTLTSGGGGYGPGHGPGHGPGNGPGNGPGHSPGHGPGH